MAKANRKYLVLVLILVFSFIYRMLLLFWSNYPPGADIGLHNSVIHSITATGNTNFMYNFYQFGGGTSLTFPGYHIFASAIALMTGMSDYIAQATVVALFSSMLVLCAFLITRRIWNESAAFIIASLAAISRFDIEMTLWGGYPNVITLMLLPLTFYLYLQKDRFTKTPFFVSTSILAGSIFLTHSLSAAIFVIVTVLTALFALIAPKTFQTNKRTGLYWLLPIVFGTILVAPFLAQAIPTYLQDNSSAPGVMGVGDINFAILSTRILPWQMVYPLFAILVVFALFSKKFNGRYVTLPTLLLSVWLFVPLFLTQGYLFGFIIDYNRFLYFIILPVLIFAAVLIDHGAVFFGQATDMFKKWSSQIQKTKTIAHEKTIWLYNHTTEKSVYASFVLFFLLICFLFIPVFMTPYQNVGETIQSFYQVIDNPNWNAIQWIKNQTNKDSLLVSDALYGWWLAGFAQRPTISAVDPQYLTSARELPYAKNATNLLDTDYLVDNGLVQVRDDGGYLARHNPEILATLNWTYFPYSFFNFGSNQNEIKYQIDGILQSVYLYQLPVTDMHLDSKPESKTIVVSRGNEYFNCTQFTTVYKGLAFVNLTYSFGVTVPGVSLDWVNIGVQSKGTQIPSDNPKTVGLIDEGVKAFGQMIFSLNQPSVITKVESPRLIDLEYQLQDRQHGEIQIMVSAYSVSDASSLYTNKATRNSYFQTEMAKNLSPQTPVDLDFEESFDYKAVMQAYSVSYVVVRNAELMPKFNRDPTFSLAFINSGVAVFKVEG